MSISKREFYRISEYLPNPGGARYYFLLGPGNEESIEALRALFAEQALDEYYAISWSPTPEHEVDQLVEHSPVLPSRVFTKIPYQLDTDAVKSLSELPSGEIVNKVKQDGFNSLIDQTKLGMNYASQ